METMVSRRGFGRLIGGGFAVAALQPATAAPRTEPVRPEPVRLSANENPYGPSPAAVQAMRDACGRAWRYPDETVDELASQLAKLHGVPPKWILIGDGSSEVLKLATSAFTGPGRCLVTAEPSFEAPAKYARAGGAEVVPVPLDAGFGHDLAKMAQVPKAGLIYVCNPNNPTASITAPDRMRAFLAAAGGPVLVDEAYHHYAEEPAYESVVPQVRERPALMVARTFSKIHGMAGVRLGYAVAQPALIEKLAAQAAWDSVNAIAVAGGRASLADATWAAEGKKRNAAIRAEVVAELGRRGYQVIPSHANFIMIDVRREVKPLIAALASRGVQVGRLFPALPHHLRVTIGKPEQMQRFLDEFRAVVS